MPSPIDSHLSEIQRAVTKALKLTNAKSVQPEELVNECYEFLRGREADCPRRSVGTWVYANALRFACFTAIPHHLGLRPVRVNVPGRATPVKILTRREYCEADLGPIFSPEEPEQTESPFHADPV